MVSMAFTDTMVQVYITIGKRWKKRKKFIKGFKTKKFRNIYQAHDYIVNGLAVEYKVLKPDQVDHNIINSAINWFFNLDDLRLDIADDMTIKQDEILII